MKPHLSRLVCRIIVHLDAPISNACISQYGNPTGAISGTKQSVWIAVDVQCIKVLGTMPSDLTQ